jgi:ketopantoate reductase
VASTICDDILAEMWSKFCGFAAVATIAALIRARGGEIAVAGAGAAFVDLVFKECARVTAAEGYPTPTEMGDLIRGMFARAGSTYGPSILGISRIAAGPRASRPSATWFAAPIDMGWRFRS